ncbi:MlaA family lipoprotein [Paraburkholderia phenoliruptrix]|uniref:MlaA family lipoprotein n=1 Tax=Paraburkholderia phenoliruptrix TaxID=252970 RepID=UPI0035B559DA
MSCLTLAALIAGVFAFSGCASGPGRIASDPLEPMNRETFSFNSKADTYVAKPLATAYQKMVPSPAQTAIRNFFSNLGDIDNFANDALQLKAIDATEDVMRLVFNSIFGIGGVIDWATPAGLPKHHQDFGLTLAHYGIPIGPYLLLPLLGPSSARDISDLAVESLLNPFVMASLPVQASVAGTRYVSIRADLLSSTQLLSQAAIDEYSLTRDFYLQRRRALASGDEGADALPDYGHSAPQ